MVPRAGGLFCDRSAEPAGGRASGQGGLGCHGSRWLDCALRWAPRDTPGPHRSCAAGAPRADRIPDGKRAGRCGGCLVFGSAAGVGAIGAGELPLWHCRLTGAIQPARSRRGLDCGRLRPQSRVSGADLRGDQPAAAPAAHGGLFGCRRSPRRRPHCPGANARDDV